jgi:hypothetical protein
MKGLLLTKSEEDLKSPRFPATPALWSAFTASTINKQASGRQGRGNQDGSNFPEFAKKIFSFQQERLNMWSNANTTNLVTQQKNETQTNKRVNNRELALKHRDIIRSNELLCWISAFAAKQKFRSSNQLETQILQEKNTFLCEIVFPEHHAWKEKVGFSGIENRMRSISLFPSVGQVKSCVINSRIINKIA